jgi:hypothetical protein
MPSSEHFRRPQALLGHLHGIGTHLERLQQLQTNKLQTNQLQTNKRNAFGQYRLEETPFQPYMDFYRRHCSPLI